MRWLGKIFYYVEAYCATAILASVFRRLDAGARVSQAPVDHFFQIVMYLGGRILGYRESVHASRILAHAPPIFPHGPFSSE